MEKESVKKFDLEAAFKALDEIEIPQTKGIKANRVDLKERFGHKPATEVLVEDYYDVSSNEDLEDAKEERDGEIAKAKLARIEKIVDLNAEKPEDLLPSYVGKVIMQCPQCMTLFYKNPEDIEPSEENPDIVNLNEPCQHCGNTSGYNLIGKVGAVTEDEADKYDETSAEENENELDLDFDKGTEEVDAEGTGEGAEEMSDEESSESEEDLDLDLNLEEVPEEEPEEEKKEESLKESKTIKQHLTVVEPGYQYKDEDGNIYTLYGDELEEDDTGIVYDWEFVNDENGDIYIREEKKEDYKENLTENWTEKFKDFKNPIVINLQGGGNLGLTIIEKGTENLAIEVDKEATRRFKLFRDADNLDEVNEIAEKEGLDLWDGAGWEYFEQVADEKDLTYFTLVFNGQYNKFKYGQTMSIEELKAELSDEDKADYPELFTESLTEAVDKDLDEKLKAHNDYIAYLQQMIEQEEKALSKADNEYIKKAIQRRIDAFKADLEEALPEELKNEVETDLPTAEEIDLEATENVEEPKEETKESLALKESVESEIDSIIASWGVNESLDLDPATAERFTKAQLDKLTPEEIKILQDPRNREGRDKIIAKYNPKYKVNEEVSLNLIPAIADRFTKSQLDKLTPEEIKILQEPHKNRAEVAKIIAKYNPKNKFNEAVKAKTTDKLCSVVLNGKQCFVGTKEECEKFIKDHKSEEAARERGGFKLLNTAEIYVNESLTEEGNLDRLLDSDEFKTPVSEEEINAARKEVARESLKEEKEDESMAPTIYNLFLDDKLVYESKSIPLNKALSEITAYIKKLTPEQKKSFSLGWEFDESEHDGYRNVPIYDNEGNIVGSRTEWVETTGDVVVGVFSESECKEYGYAFPEDRLVVNVDYAGDAIRKALDDEESEEEVEEPEFNEDDIDELDEDSLNKHIDEYLKEVYSNVKSYKTTGCELKEGKLIVEGKISFNSGKEKLTMFEFLPAYCKGNLFFEGYNKDFSEDKAFTLNCSINEAKKLITESFGYKYKINKNLVKGLK